jgi:hypothetical protein
MLKDVRAAGQVQDGRQDDEVAGLSEKEDEADLEDVGDDDELMFD